jgi:hypothetical protein
VDGRRVFAGECRFSRRPVSGAVLRRDAARFEARPLPPPLAGREIVRALFVPSTPEGTPRTFGGVHVLTCDDILRAE